VRVTYSGPFNVTNETLTMDGHITTTNNSPDVLLENVTLYFYAGNGTLVEERRVGSFRSTGESVKMSATVSPLPGYVVIGAEEIWNNDDIVVDYYIQQSVDGETVYKVHTTQNRSGLPVDHDR